MEEIVKECETVKHTKCLVEENKKCSLEYRKNCSERTKKVCRTIKPTKCSPRVKPVISALECQPKYTRQCKHEWQDRGEIEVLTEVAGSCKHVETVEEECNYRVEDVRNRTVCQKRPKRVCEWRQTSVKCEEKPENVCDTSPEKVCREEPKIECKNVLKKKYTKLSKIIPTSICR